jgi:hypothetical protein
MNIFRKNFASNFFGSYLVFLAADYTACSPQGALRYSPQDPQATLRYACGYAHTGPAGQGVVRVLTYSPCGTQCTINNE